MEMEMEMEMKMEMGIPVFTPGAISRVEDAYPDPYDIMILVVEEDPSYLNTITEMLQRHRYKVTGKTSPEEGLRALQENPEGFDLVMSVAYTQGPGIDGFELLKHAMETHPVVLLADSAPGETVMRALVGGACGFLVKPLYDSEVHNIWQHVIRRKLQDETSRDRDADADADVVILPDGTARKRGSQGLDDSGEGGSDGSQHQQKQGRTTKKTNFNSSPHQHALFIEADEQLRGTQAMETVDQKEGSGEDVHPHHQDKSSCGQT